MSDGAGGGGAAGGAAPAGGAAGAPAAKGAPATVTTIPKPATKAPEKGKKPEAPAEGEWGDADEEAVSKLLKRAPWAKVKANGKERAITSREEFLALATDASRSLGMNKQVEATKKEREEAAKEKAEALGYRELVDRARKGDVAARRELGLVPDTERAELQKQWEALPPEVQETYRRNHELETEAATLKKEKADRETDEKSRAKKANEEKVLSKAREHLKVILKDVKAELHDVELPEIIGAMHAMGKTGAKLGVDYDEAQLAAYVSQRRTAALDTRYSALKPEAAVKMALPHLKALVATPEGLAALEEALGVDFEGIFKPISDHRLSKWKANKQKQALSGDVKKPGERQPSTVKAPLPLFRF